MEGPTYKLILLYESIEFKKRLIELKKYIDMRNNAVRLFRKRIANITGAHHFFDSYLPSIINTTSESIVKNLFSFNLTSIIFSNYSENCNATVYDS
jgi:hypothetical protein